MERFMNNSGILLTINLKGVLTGKVKHTTTQEVKVNISPSTTKTILISSTILHTDRTASICTKKTKISEEAVNAWTSNECPYWERPVQWRSMNTKQRLESHLNRFDEGYGISYELIEQ